MAPRSFRFSLLAASWLCFAPCRPSSAQDLQPTEQAAFAARARGDHAGSAKLFLDQAEHAAAGANDPVVAARIEAWATIGARFARGNGDVAILARLDGLRRHTTIAQCPLLVDRLAMLALELAETLPNGDSAARAKALGFPSEGWLLGPLPNERGSGMPQTLPPETKLDLDAELPGKVRPVRWRALPARLVSPLVPLDRIVQPHEQCLVYFAVGVTVPTATEAVLELGSTGSWVVFCNGSEVQAREVERPFAYDQDAVALSLAAGNNFLLLKLGHQEGADFSAAVRLRARDGSSLPGLQWLAARGDVLAAASRVRAGAPERGERQAAPPIALGGRTTWPIGTTAGADALRLAWLWRARDADGDRDRRDGAAAAAAVQALPDLADAWLVLAATKIRHARSTADRDDNERRRCLQTALAKSPGHVDATTQLGNLLCSGSNLWRQARDLATTALANAPGASAAALLRARTLRDEGLGELADAEILRLANGNQQLEVVRSAAAILTEREATAALALRRAAWAATSTEFDLLALADQLLRTGGDDEAARLLADFLQRDPFARRVVQKAADLALARDDARTAITLLEQWLTLAPDDADAMVRAGRCWRALAATEPGAKERQLELLRSALQVEPNRRDDERLAEWLAKEVEGGAAAEAFFTPWQVAAEPLVRADPGPPTDAEAARDSLHWLLRQKIVRANRNGTTNTYSHEVVRVRTVDGARSLQNWQLDFYRGEQRARLLGCTIFRADGTVQKPALQGARVRLPDLRPGDVVAVEGRVDDLMPTFFGDYFGLVHTFASRDGSPVRTDDLLVLAAPGRDYRWQAAQGAPEPVREMLPDGTLSFRFVMHELGRDRPEVQRPQRRELEPTVRMTTYRDWGQFAAWWWNLIKNQLEVTPAMQRTVQERCAGLATIDEKIAALYHFVTADVRYEAWEFGVHGYKPYSTAVIHERRHGDCKDKALLLCALLREIGVTCHPVLIFGDPWRTNDDLSLPMVQHFNHCIAWLPPQLGRPGRFLDGTATWHPTDTLPEMDQGAQVLVVTPERAELLSVPWTTPAANVERRDYRIELAADGSARLQLAQRPLGNRAVTLRSALATEPARLRDNVERSLMQTFGQANLTGLTPGVSPDPEQPVHLLTTAALPEIGLRTATGWQLPSSWADDSWLAHTSEAERRAPLLLGVPTGEHDTVRYVLPGGWRVGELPRPVAQQTPFGRFAMQWRADGDSVVVERDLQLTQARIVPAQYQAFRDFVAAIKAADDQLVLLRAEGGR